MTREIFILTTEDPERGGGAETFVRELIDGLEARGYAVRVFHKGNCLPAFLRECRGRFMRTISDAALGWHVSRGARRNLSANVVAIISNSTVGWHSPRNRRYNGRAIHFFHGTYRGQASAISPFISRLGAWKLTWWDSMILERMSGTGKLTLCNSPQTEDEVRRFFGLAPVNVWLPLDTSQFRPLAQDQSRLQLGLPPNKPIGLFVGSTSPVKNFGLIRSLMAKLPHVFWLLAINGESPAELGNFQGVVHTNVVRHELPTFYAAADFSVCPSLYEAFGYVVAESLACGIPVIASPGGASRAFLTQDPFKQLLISDPTSVVAFADAAREILRTPEFYRRKVQEIVRPCVVELMEGNNWWQRFFERAGLNNGN